MNDLKTLFKIKEHRKKWIAWVVSLTVVLCGLLIVLDHYRAAGKLTINPFSIIKGYIDNEAHPPYFLLLLILIFVLASTTSKMVKAIAELRARGVNWAEKNTYGSAQEATAEEIEKIAAIKPAAECEGPILGRLTHDGNTDCIEFRPDAKINKNTLILGPPGTGKSWCYVLSAIYQAIKREESVFVADTKGAIYNATIELARKNGYVVRCFNLKDFAYSHGWNIFREIYDPKTGEISAERVTMLADIIIKNKSGSGTQEIYIDGPTALLQAAIHYVASNNSYGEGPGKKPRSLAAAYQLMLNTTETELDRLFDRDNQLCSDAAVDSYNAYKRASQNFRGNLVTNLTMLLKSLSQPLIKEITSRDEIDLSLPAKQKCIYYLTVPDMENPYEIYSALFVQFLFRDLTEFADSLNPQVCPVPVNMILDEFANLGTLIEFEKKPATTRSRNIYIAIIVQSLAQLKKKYFESWEIIGNTCATWIGLGFNDLFTQEYFSTKAGQATISTTSEQQPAHMPFFKIALPHSVGEGKRNVINPDELGRLLFEELVILFQGHNVLRAYKFPHNEHPYAKMCVPTEIYNMPKINDEKGRAYWNAMEQERIYQYNAWRNSGMAGPAPKTYTLKELASGKFTLTDYRKTRSFESIAVDVLNWVDGNTSNDTPFAGHLTPEETKEMKSHAGKANSKQEKRESEPLQTVISEAPLSAAPTPKPAAPAELSDIFAAEQSDNNDLAAAFGFLQNASTNPSTPNRRTPDHRK